MRRRLCVLVLLCLMIIAAVVAGVPAYVRPQIDSLRHADAILILGGPDYERYVYGLRLGSQGWAPNVVVSNPHGPDDPWLTRYCATPQTRFQAVLLQPGPRQRRKAKGESYNDWPRNTAGEQSSLSRCDPISPEPDSFWNSASAVNW